MEQFAPLQNARPVTRFFLFMSLFLLCSSFGAIIGQMIIKSICGCEMPDTSAFISTAQENPAFLSGIRISVIFSQFIGFALPAFFLPVWLMLMYLKSWN
ncbi:MAG: hypothetical protein M0D57_16440 [Sphingobacteriales bacterium JAD_PAG50586_3]|nr:MAG: hypothetical protein M0D57_16440 [Sphingobacteriales bacterium JAD_PAG50586_3]